METIEENYVSFEIAKILKERGFNEPVQSYYDVDGKQGFFTSPRSCNIGTGSVYACPTIQTLIIWLIRIEEKSQRYDDVLKKAEALYNTTEHMSERSVVETLFPELKESEDKKNIKDLIDELKRSLRAANCQNDACGGGHEKRIALLEWSINWLKKQGEQKPVWSGEDEEHTYRISSILEDQRTNKRR